MYLLYRGRATTTPHSHVGAAVLSRGGPDDEPRQFPGPPTDSPVRSNFISTTHNPRPELASSEPRMAYNGNGPLNPGAMLNPPPQPLLTAKTTVQWPLNTIPVEIFNAIMSYLPRQDQASLRLVGTEFEQKCSAKYFQSVVVPFKGELYTSFAADVDGVLRRQPSTLMSDGMRIFQAFGHHVSRFVLSLELNEDTLSYPPLKPTQEAVPAFWGIYRWPHSEYFRFKDLKSLEQTADETEAMKEALGCLAKVSNLGLRCDAGLGFLVGPDATEELPGHEAHPLLPPQPYPPSNLPDAKEPLQATRQLADRSNGSKRTVLEQMARNAGFGHSQIAEAVQIMLDTEGATLSSINFEERTTRMGWPENLVANAAENMASPPSASTRHPLVPAGLTKAQKEMLLELEWAHRAMIQSFVISIIDNASEGTLQNLTTLTIAKIPSSHLHMLCHQELWESLPCLEEVSLGVIPDWRHVHQSAPGFIEDIPVAPSSANDKVWDFLSNYIGVLPNIHTLHFEWICGGELAQGCFQRNNFILMMPLIEHAAVQTAPDVVIDKGEELLRLPFVRNLSLKNCWATPQTFLQFIRLMALSSLETLQLESVSLSGPPTLRTQAPLQQVSMPTAPVPPAEMIRLGSAWDQIAYITADGQQLPEVSAPGGNLHIPSWLSWPGIIEHFSPSTRICDLMTERASSASCSPLRIAARRLKAVVDFVPETENLLGERASYKLRSLSFKSCGYISISHGFIDTRSILPHNAQGVNANANTHREDISRMMMSTTDFRLARIAPYFPEAEARLLTNAFGMHFGWKKVYPESVIQHAITDGVMTAGRGRFSGALEGNQEDSPEVHRRLDDIVYS